MTKLAHKRQYDVTLRRTFTITVFAWDSKDATQEALEAESYPEDCEVLNIEPVEPPKMEEEV